MAMIPAPARAGLGGDSLGARQTRSDSVRLSLPDIFPERAPLAKPRELPYPWDEERQPGQGAAAGSSNLAGPVPAFMQGRSKVPPRPASEGAYPSGSPSRRDSAAYLPSSSPGRDPKHRSGGGLSGTTSPDRLGSGVPAASEAEASAWQYLEPFLREFAPQDALDYLQQVLSHACVRPLSSLLKHELHRIGGDATAAAKVKALVLYLVGVKSYCTNCGELDRVGVGRQNKNKPAFDMCVAVALDAPPPLLEYLGPTCCNCLIGGHSRPCIVVRPIGAATAAATAAKSRKRKRSSSLDLSSEPSSDGQTDASLSQDRQSAPSVDADDDGSSGSDEGGPSRTANADTTCTLRSAHGKPIVPVEAEQWEFAPGRIRANIRGSQTNIAFSNAYQAQNEVAVADGITTRVVSVKPYTAQHFYPESRALRVCHITAGKLRVKMEGEEFSIGPGGTFRIDVGVAAKVENWLYVDAAVFVTSVMT